MRPLFTIHAGEFLVGEYIERHFPALNIWIPAKDTGVDLLVTGKPTHSPVSLQVKLSRDYKAPEARNDFERIVLGAGWLTINHAKLAASRADWWVIVVVSHERNMAPQYIVIEPKELLKRLVNTHGKSKSYHFYPWVTKTGIALDGRGLMKAHKKQIVEGTMVLGSRDLTSFLGDWTCLENLT